MGDEATKVILGGHWNDAPGWEIYTEAQIDITRALPWVDDFVDVVFTEHVIEHVSFVDAVAFFQEAYRVLRPGGRLRTVFPSAEMRGADAEYTQNALRDRFSDESRALHALGLSLDADPDVFMRMSMYTMHGHRFIWSPALMVQVLRRIGFSETKCCAVGYSDGDIALERRRRGHYLGNSYSENAAVELEEVYDPESSVVEAVK